MVDASSAILAQQGQGGLHDRNVRSAHFFRAELFKGANAVNEGQRLTVVPRIKRGVNLCRPFRPDVDEAGREPAGPDRVELRSPDLGQTADPDDVIGRGGLGLGQLLG